MKAIRITEYGPADAMSYGDTPPPVPGPGEALVTNQAIGVNFIDIYQRTGRYAIPLPATLGNEGAGVVAALGEGVTDWKIGDRVAYVGVLGSYAEQTIVKADRLVPVPAGLDAATAAAAIEQGMTAHYLAHDSYRIKPGDSVLVHAAAGGTGRLLTQVAKRLGARVIATVSTEAKAEIARAAGADEIILYSEQDFEAETLRLTGGRGVDAAYDSVGKTTFEKSLAVLRPRGTLVLFGAASGPAPALDPQRLTKGSLFLTRPSLTHYTADRAELLGRAADIFAWVLDGSLKLHIGQTYALAEAAQAHRDLESRATTGKLLLQPPI
ncbi:MAG TPA: quinone oxidoreductase [Herpetosiphonaceae bacterium]